MYHIFTYYTNTHQEIVDKYFKPYFEKWVKYLPAIYQPIQFHPYHDTEQCCPDGAFGSKGFNTQMQRRMLALLNKTCLAEEDDIMINIDVDVLLLDYRFMDTIHNVLVLGNEISDEARTIVDNYINIIAQDDGYAQLCAGFFAFNVSPETLFWLKEIIRITPLSRDDQTAFNEQIEYYDSEKFKQEEVLNIYHIQRRLWNGESFKLPFIPSAFHANYTVGVENKLKLLDAFTKQLPKEMRI